MVNEDLPEFIDLRVLGERLYQLQDWLVALARNSQTG
jgi:hypothetical protein